MSNVKKQLSTLSIIGQREFEPMANTCQTFLNIRMIHDFDEISQFYKSRARKTCKRAVTRERGLFERLANRPLSYRNQESQLNAAIHSVVCEGSNSRLTIKQPDSRNLRSTILPVTFFHFSGGSLGSTRRQRRPVGYSDVRERRLAKFRQNVARFRLYRLRFLKENMRFAAFFKIYQILQLKFLKFGKSLQILRHLQLFS